MKWIYWIWQRQPIHPDPSVTQFPWIGLLTCFASAVPFGFWVPTTLMPWLDRSLPNLMPFESVLPTSHAAGGSIAPVLTQKASSTTQPPSSQAVLLQPPPLSPAEIPPQGAPSTTTPFQDSSEPSASACLVAPSPIDRLIVDTGMRLFTTWQDALIAQFSPRPFPEIHGMARFAKVPIIMYHDVLPEKQVFFDVTPTELAADFEQIRQQGLTPIHLDQLVLHLSTGIPLPPQPILLSFDDGYQGHYDYVYPLLKQYGYPAAFGIYTQKVGKTMGRSSLNWQMLRTMAADPLVTIAAHSLTHPPDLSQLADQPLRQEIQESKRILETELGIAIDYFIYPAGKYDERVQQQVQQAGYRAAFTMDDQTQRFAGESKDLLSIERIGQGSLETILDQASSHAGVPRSPQNLQLTSPVQLHHLTVAEVPLMMVSGGRPVTIHADRRYQVREIIAGTNALAAVDGGFFSLESLDSNVMVGPVYSQNTRRFVAGNPVEIARIARRPLVLISPTTVKFIPFDPARHNTLAGIQAELPHLTDAFVAAAWLVREGMPQPAEAFGNLLDFDAARDRAFWGIDQAGQPILGTSGDYVDSITLGQALSQAGLRDAVMLDSGASASLVFQGQSQMSYEPRPVPHVVALVPPQGLQMDRSCFAKTRKEAG
ncbi:MAG: polysaccharide deacetylase family protein [Elainella sp. Prado103]|jgi:peptidoglycan/xylan/chitin deacetylase (PgdA/CDA1 family)|nr:polysaccharide deacetylase family protein [Elainella sp. Prado103]